MSSILACSTTEGWLNAAINNLDIILIDHAHCEKKAAYTAMHMIYRYPLLEHYDLMQQMSRLAREEMRHFERVLALIKKRNIEYKPIPASRYAKGLHQHIRDHEPAHLIDSLIVGAFIEARSHERFTLLVPHLDEELADFYNSLLESEKRHCVGYLSLAEKYANEEIKERVIFFAEIEKELILSDDNSQVRFHSGNH